MIDINDFIYDIPQNWCWSSLSLITRLITDGTHKTPYYVSNGIPFLSIQNISKGFFDSSKIKYITQNEHEELTKRCKPEKNDILLCRIGTLGKPYISNFEFEYSIFVSLALIKVMNKVNINYLNLVLSSPQINKYIDHVKVGGGTHTNKINIESLSTFPIPIPPLDEQLKIVAKYTELEEIIKVI